MLSVQVGFPWTAAWTLARKRCRPGPQSALKCRVSSMSQHGSYLGWDNSMSIFPLMLKVIALLSVPTIREFEFSDSSGVTTELYTF